MLERFRPLFGRLEPRGRAMSDTPTPQIDIAQSYATSRVSKGYFNDDVERMLAVAFLAGYQVGLQHASEIVDGTSKRIER